MHRHRLDDSTADQLLAGALSPADTPPGYERVSQWVSDARRPPAPGELANEATVVAAVAAAVASTPATLPIAPRRKSMLKKALTAKAIAIAAVTFLGAGTAAAATNNLPDPAQNAVSKAAKRVGLKVAKAQKSGDHTPGNGKAKGPDATGSAKKGLCNAYLHGTSTTNPNSGKANSVAFQNLAKAAADAGQSIPDYCKDVTEAKAAKQSDESKPEDEKVDDRGGGKPDNAGNSAEHSKVSTPNSGGKSQHGTDNAGDKSNGASSAGSPAQQP